MIVREYLLISVLWALSVFSGLAAAGEPTHSVTSFQNLPSRLFFFDDSTNAVYHDSVEGNVYISEDEGKSWKKAEGIPGGDAMMVFEHPFDNKFAFVLTRGTKHYRTEDRGRTWRSFDMPVPPALVARPLSFHSAPSKYGYILYQGTTCVRLGWGEMCHDETYYTKDAFADEPQKLLSDTSRCQFAHSSKDFKHSAHSDLIYCVAFSSTGDHSVASSLLFSSTSFFSDPATTHVEDLGIGKNAKGVLALAIVSKFAVVALKGADGEMTLYVSVDTVNWAKARFPHASSSALRENAYTIVESTTHSLAVDVVLSSGGGTMGTLFVSNSNGTFFVESLKDTNRNEMGFVDYERVYGVEGVGIANVVANPEAVERSGAPKQLRSLITFDDGSTWFPLATSNSFADRLHLHSVTTPHNFGRIFSSPAPGLVMGVGSVSDTLLPYEDCDTYLSLDGGVKWTKVRDGAHKYEFGDSGSVLVMVGDEEPVSEVVYSTDLGRNWKTYDLGLKLRARALLTLPDSTSQKFILVGQVGRKDAEEKGTGRFVTVFLDFAQTRDRKCVDPDDFEKWYARPPNQECLMGHKQWYRRRKTSADCYVGDKFIDPVEHEDNCSCTEQDYECDFNYVLTDSNTCTPVGPEPIPAGMCSGGGKYLGSSGWRKIPGNTCEGGKVMDAKVEKDCSQAQPEEGQIIHQTFEFPGHVVQHAYFKGTTTILARVSNGAIFQSSNEGYIWKQIQPNTRFLAFYHHPYSPDRAYLITASNTMYITTDAGRQWIERPAPLPPNTIFRGQVLRFHTNSDLLVWIGNKNCPDDPRINQGDCHSEAYYSRDNGIRWHFVEKYVRNCAWASDTKLLADPTEIICESYSKKEGNQRFFSPMEPLELVEGPGYFEAKRRRKLFDHVVGFAKFSEFLVVAEMHPVKKSLALQVSLDGIKFAEGLFPPSMHPETHAYTVLESSTGSLFLHMTMSEPPAPYWGNILKSNSNGTYFGLSLENVNRNEEGYVDFEKMIGLDGIALVNVVANPSEAMVTGHKEVQTRITHNDGGSWKPLVPPKTDSLGRSYECTHVRCALHVHGYTERTDPRATYSSPSVVGLLMAVGNVGETLAPYTDSDTFLSRDGGFTWEEVHKDAHLWEFGDSGSILVMANDEEPTDHILFSTDEGLNWREYKFTSDGEKMRVKSIVTVPSDTSRRFILIGQFPRSQVSTAVHIDFTTLTSKKCVLSVEDPGHDDFELWSPSEERSEKCLFGRQTLYHRRVREANCVVGNQPKAEERVQKNCACTRADFECEFNYVKNANDECVLVPGTTPLPDDETCADDEDYWYSRTAYRKIPYSTCEGGERPDRGTKHSCPGLRGHGFFFWVFVLAIPFGFCSLVGYYYYKKSGLARGTIRLPGDGSGPSFKDGGFIDTLASIPWFLVGVASVAWEWVVSRVESLPLGFRSRRGYRGLPVDEDARILRFDDEN